MSATSPWGLERHQEGLELTPAATVFTQDPHVTGAVERSDALCLSWAHPVHGQAQVVFYPLSNMSLTITQEFQLQRGMNPRAAWQSLGSEVCTLPFHMVPARSGWGHKARTHEKVTGTKGPGVE